MELGILSSLILAYILFPVYTYYVYDETSNVGFVSDNAPNIGAINQDTGVSIINNVNTASQSQQQLQEPLSYSLHSMYSGGNFGAGKRFHSNARSGAYMVDSHFRVLKESPTSTKADQRVIKFNIDQVPSVPKTEAPVEQRKYVEEQAVKTADPKNFAVAINGFVQPNYIRDANGVNSGASHTKPVSKVTKDHHDPYLINVHRTQVTTGQKVKFSPNLFNIRSNEAPAMAQQNKLEDIPPQAKSNYNNPINQKKLDRRHYDETEYQKDLVASPGTDPNKIKLQIEKDQAKSGRSAGDIPRIGAWQESVDIKPYALFYRISQDPTRRQFDNVQHFMSDDEKAGNFGDQVINDVPAVQPTISPNTLKLRMKIKKYSNFRSH